MFNFFDKTDSEIREDVINELSWDPSLDSTEIMVSSRDGVVTLSGTVPHFIEKEAAEHATQRVGGVRAVADELGVKTAFDKSDEDIAVAALNALNWNYSAPDHVKVTVSKGWITLEGEAEWDYQRNAAKDSVSQLLGVNGVTNNISIKTKIQSADIKTRIEEALRRSAESEGREISVSVTGDKVTLSGKVRSYAEINDARDAAWMAPGVSSVENNLVIAR